MLAKIKYICIRKYIITILLCLRNKTQPTALQFAHVSLLHSIHILRTIHVEKLFRLYQGSQNSRAACGPRRRDLRPATHYLKFQKFVIK